MQADDIQTFLRSDYHCVVGVVTAVCGDPQRAEDAVQEAIVDVWAKRRDVEDLVAWVTTAAINRSRSRWRSLAAEQRAFERLRHRNSTRTGGGEHEAFDGELVAALRTLPRAQRVAVALHYLLDMSVVDIARHLGIAEGTVKTHLHRGREALRSALSGEARSEEAHHA